MENLVLAFCSDKIISTLLLTLLSCVTCVPLGDDSVCTAEELATYSIVFTGKWSQAAFPKQYPLYRPPAQWSALLGKWSLRSTEALASSFSTSNILFPPWLQLSLSEIHVAGRQNMQYHSCIKHLELYHPSPPPSLMLWLFLIYCSGNKQHTLHFLEKK